MGGCDGRRFAIVQTGGEPDALNSPYGKGKKMNCHRCGSPLVAGAPFCHRCGAAVEDAYRTVVTAKQKERTSSKSLAVAGGIAGAVVIAILFSVADYFYQSHTAQKGESQPVAIESSTPSPKQQLTLKAAPAETVSVAPPPQATPKMRASVPPSMPTPPPAAPIKPTPQPTITRVEAVLTRKGVLP